MAWININDAFTSEGMIVGQNDFNIKIQILKKLKSMLMGLL